MNAQNETASGPTEAADTAEHNTTKNTAPNAQAQAKRRWEVRTTRHPSCGVVVFSTHTDYDESLAVAKRIRQIGGNAFVVEVTR
jgi:hypothetical protein